MSYKACVNVKLWNHFSWKVALRISVDTCFYTCFTTNMKISSNSSLATLNSFGFQVQARYLTWARNRDDLDQALLFAEQKKLPTLVLGGGSNVILTHNFNGLAIRMATRGIEIGEEQSDSVLLRIQAGEDWPQLVHWCLQHGFYGLENLAGIPGTAGAAPIQNIGAYGVSLHQRLLELHALRRIDKKIVRFSVADCKLDYRDSYFKSTAPDEYIILSITIKLLKKPNVYIDYRALQSRFEGENHPTPLQVYDAVMAIRQSKLPDPQKLGNAGSFFKNPIVESKMFQSLQKHHPTLVGYQQHDRKYKISAAWLIESLGYKGYRKGAVGVYQHHSLILVNHKDAQPQQVLELAEEIQQAAKKRYGIDLEIEPRIV